MGQDGLPSEESELEKAYNISSETKVQSETGTLETEKRKKLESLLINGLVRKLSTGNKRPSAATVISAIGLLFGLGMANRETPGTVFVKIAEDRDSIYKLTKDMFVEEFQKVYGTKQLRKFANPNATIITKIIYTNNKEGDLYRQFEKMIQDQIDLRKEGQITRKERAWCSSFNTNNPDLNKDPELSRVRKFLIEDKKRRIEELAPKVKKAIVNNSVKKIVKKAEKLILTETLEAAKAQEKPPSPKTAPIPEQGEPSPSTEDGAVVIPSVVEELLDLEERQKLSTEVPVGTQETVKSEEAEGAKPPTETQNEPEKVQDKDKETPLTPSTKQGDGRRTRKVIRDTTGVKNFPPETGETKAPLPETPTE